MMLLLIYAYVFIFVAVLFPIFGRCCGWKEIKIKTINPCFVLWYVCAGVSV